MIKKVGIGLQEVNIKLTNGVHKIFSHNWIAVRYSEKSVKIAIRFCYGEDLKNLIGEHIYDKYVNDFNEQVERYEFKHRSKEKNWRFEIPLTKIEFLTIDCKNY